MENSSWVITETSLAKYTITEATDEADDELIALYNRMTLIMWRYVLMIPLFGGLLANLFCLLTLQMSSFRESGSGFLLTALTVVDMLALGVGALHAWILALFNIDLRLFTVQGCRVHVYFTYLTVHLSAWTLSLITLERLIAVTRPLQVAWLCTRRRLALAWTTITVILTITDIYLPLHLDIVVSNSTSDKSCIFTRNPNALYWVDICFSFVIPFVVILCGNLAILYKLIRNSSGYLGRSVDHKTRSITVMLMVASTLFVVTTLPINIYSLGHDTFFSLENYNAVSIAEDLLLEAVTTVIYYFNNAGNFGVYLLSGPRFRKAFKGIFCQYKNGESSSSINTIASQVVFHNNVTETDNEE